MMLSSRLGRCGVLLTAFLLTPGLSLAFTPGVAFPAALTIAWPMILGLAALACVVLLILLYVFGDASARRRRSVVQARLDNSGLPSAISGIDGRLEWVNSAMSAPGDAAKGDIGELMAEAGIRIGPADIYRLVSRARELGFALEPVHDSAGDGSQVLAVRFDAPSRFIWTLLPRDRLPAVTPLDGADAYEAAPFAHVRIEPDGVFRANAQFREMIGDVSSLPDGSATGGDDPVFQRHLLHHRDGSVEMSNICVVPVADGVAGARDVFVFGQGGTNAAPGAKSTLDAVPIALMQFDFDGRMLWYNAAAHEMLGRELSPGMALTELVEPLGRPIDALLADTIANAKGRREMVRLRGDDAETFLQVALTPVTLDENPSLLAVLSDASELRLLEDKFAQSQKMEAVGKLAGGVAHDFNNVLTAISGHSDLLLLGKDALHPDYSDLMQIRQNTHRAAALVRQLLAFSRKQTLNPVLMSVQDVVSDTQYLLNRLIGEKITLAMEHGRDLGTVRADHQQLEQALMNLVVNARDAMPGGGMITIATSNVTLGDKNPVHGVEIPSGDYVEISVSDDGAGIEPHLIDRVFDPFFTTKPVGEGTGLGLSTVYGIVKQSGGYIFAENRPTGGACFRILLPRVYPGSQDMPLPRAAPVDDRGDLTGKGHILLVEDEDPVRSFASRALRLRGYEVAEAASAEEAMELLTDDSNLVDVLVSDVVMPGMDGPTFAAHARKMRPGLQVVFISGYAEDSFRRNLIDHDFMFLPKPFSLTDLTAKVREALDRAH
jgi:two-component system cell cycle sensor histidine kinase/response regulator CckA